MSEVKEQENLSRRKFFIGSAAFAVGAVAAGATMGINPKVVAAAAPPIPFPYEIIDVDLVRRRGYDYYFTGGCMYTVAKALLDTLVETVGAPWDTIPADMFKFGKGGAVNWGTLCGALNGCFAVIELASGNAAETIGPELMGWYTRFPFPSSAHEGYCKVPNQITTISDSPLCHQSVTQWSVAAGDKISSAEKKDRCAKLAGDTAAKTAELLNQWKLGTFVVGYKPDADIARCFPCHVGPTSRKDNVQAQMDCLECHTDRVNHQVRR